MKKTGILTRVNRGLRAWLFEIGIRIQQTDFQDLTAGREMVMEMKDLINAINRKSSFEENCILPALAVQAPLQVSLIDIERLKLGGYVEKTLNLLDSFLEPGTCGRRSQIANQLFLVYTELLGFMLAYMNRQETIMNEYLQDEFSATETIQLHAAERIILTEWMLKGMNELESAEWLSEKSHMYGDSTTWKISVSAKHGMAAA
jgi:hypothetical protein